MSEESQVRGGMDELRSWLDDIDSAHFPASNFRLLDHDEAMAREQARYEILRALPHLTRALRAVAREVDAMTEAIATLDGMATAARERGDLMSEGAYLLQREVLTDCANRVSAATGFPMPHRVEEQA